MHDPFAYSHVVFDWNGTIVDDVALAVESVNAVRANLDLPDVTLAAYRSKFRFPIRDFYADLGFDLDRHGFEHLVAAYLERFDAGIAECEFCPGVHALVSSLHDNGTRIAVLSASHQETLQRTASRNGIQDRIDLLFGLQDSAANGKVERARDLDRHLRRSVGDRVLMIGDTDHDAAVARDRGWDFLAVATGHQDIARLSGLGSSVCATLVEVLKAGVA